MANYLITNRYKCGVIDHTLFIKQSGSHITLAHLYIDDIIFASIDETMSIESAGVVAKKFEMSMRGELTFFLGLQVKQLTDAIFIYQAKYVVDLRLL